MAGVALVVGAGDALGGAIAERFAQGGFHAVPSRRKTAPLEALAERIRAGGGTATPVACDARDEDAVIAMFDRSRPISVPSRSPSSTRARGTTRRSRT